MSDKAINTIEELKAERLRLQAELTEKEHAIKTKMEYLKEHKMSVLWSNLSPMGEKTTANAGKFAGIAGKMLPFILTATGGGSMLGKGASIAAKLLLKGSVLKKAAGWFFKK